MLKSFKYRLVPTKEQTILLNKHIGCVRFIYNLALETKQMAYSGNRINLSCFDLINQLPGLKDVCPWLKEVNSQSLQQPIRNLDNSFTRFFKGQSQFPKFKKKSSCGSFNIPQEISLKGDKLMIPKFKGGISIILHRAIKGTIKQATITRTVTDKYFVSILCETGESLNKKKSIKENNIIGIDLGIKSFIATSTNQEFDNPRFFRKSLPKLIYIHRKYSKYKGKRTKCKLAKIHEKITNQRKDYLHKVSIQLIRENQSIAIETLKVANMLKNSCLSKSIQDAGWRMFVDFLKYKSEWYGVNILEIGTFEPSSKTCSNCGRINKELTLKDREWACPCGVNLNRDVNAAINIKNFALKNYLSVGRRLENRNELPTLVGVMTSGANII